jgi:hypothetical protein
MHGSKILCRHTPRQEISRQPSDERHDIDLQRKRDRARFMFIEHVGESENYSLIETRAAIYVFQLYGTRCEREFPIRAELLAKWLRRSRPTAYRVLAELVSKGALCRVKGGVYRFAESLTQGETLNPCREERKIQRFRTDSEIQRLPCDSQLSEALKKGHTEEDTERKIQSRGFTVWRGERATRESSRVPS